MSSAMKEMVEVVLFEGYLIMEINRSVVCLQICILFLRLDDLLNFERVQVLGP